MNKTLSLALPLLLAGVLGAGCGLGADGTTSTERVAPAPSVDGARVDVAQVYPSAATVSLSLTGEVQGDRDANLASALGGFIEAVQVRTGATVQEGQTLIEVDRQTHAAGYRQAKAQAELATSELARLKAMGDGVSESQLQQAVTQEAVAQAAQAQALVRLRRASIIAPFDGVVSAVNAEEGEVAGPGAPLLRVVQLEPVRVVLAVSDRDVVSLESGIEVSVTAGAIGQRLDGVVRAISPVGDGQTRSFQVEVEVENPDRKLLPGMVARVQLHRELGQAMIVPSDWILSTPDGHGVYVESDGVASWRAVELGRVLQNQIVVESGLEEGAAVIMVGHRELLDGDPVLVARRGRCCTDGRVEYDTRGDN